ncbi:methylated-DNA--[protein]-cysteine S-methyltransferase [Woeseia oceani]|uniref:Methylated-DNA--protein-cysteine methyltransferase n=1 Tax=Woeseia oceani TaxID=1548547 RepID=A0A193LDZ8_9GAMM|nr:methylated-DNA--[protein]-cysteine S-methyltransferase [Woeseia oceani]ANO50609.1 cysteine methyltransferase [Woeseia oceani]
MYYCYLTTPIGDLLLAGDAQHLHVISFPEGPKRRDPMPEWIYSESPFADARAQLLEYFCGTRQTFDLQLAPSGTEFQLAVLAELQAIPYGTTVSYADIACRIGRPTAVRAVGAANGRNPIPIVIPCHRVIGSDGKLTGFGGGLPVKEALLRLELEHSQLLPVTP